MIPSTPDLAVWSVIAPLLPSAILGLLAWFARNALADIKESLVGVNTRLDGLAHGLTAQDKAIALIEQRLGVLESEARHRHRKDDP